MLRNLLRLHERYPDAIIAHRAKRLKPNAPYRKWRRYKWYGFFMKILQPRLSNLQTGVAGVLYPPNSLASEMLDSKIFMEIAPTADDLWFWAAAVANRTKIAPVPFGHCKPRSLGKPIEIQLRFVNLKSGVDVNRAVLEKIFKKYPIIKERIENEK
jgi:hypothetical protein